MGKKSRRKGYSGEAEAAAILTKMFYPDGKGKVVRTPMSGAWKGMNVMTGDVLFLVNEALDNSVPLKVEVKRTAKKYSPVLSWLSGEVSMLERFLKQVEENCPSGKLPLVMWRTDFSPWFVIFRETDFGVMGDWFGILPSCTTLRAYKAGAPGLVMMPFESWRSWVDIEVLRGKEL